MSVQIPESERIKATGAVERTASATEFARCKGFHANNDGTVTVQFADSGSTVDLLVIAGASYAYEINKFTAGTDITLVTLY